MVAIRMLVSNFRLNLNDGRRRVPIEENWEEEEEEEEEEEKEEVSGIKAQKTKKDF